MAAFASPFWLRTKACGASRPSFSIWAIVALETLAFGPSSHAMGSASRAVLASHHVSATTATADSPTGSTCRTPGMPLTLAASKPFTLPPKTGQSLIAALRIPGSLRSAPYTCAPVSLAIVSRRFTDLPISFQSFGSLSGASAGGVSLAAASATLPYLVVRPVGLWVITLLAALHYPHDAALRHLGLGAQERVEPALHALGVDPRQPDCTAMYCTPSTANALGMPVTPELVFHSQSASPFLASNARNIRSLVPPMKTRPPPVVSTGPQFCPA